MISVVVATYNGARYIYQQLSSIYNQTHQVDEVIISDDVSTDNTVAIAKAFIEDKKLENWQIFVNDVNLGFSNNFLSAIKRTKGDIIFLSDQDDEWETNKVEIMYPIIGSNDNICSLSSRYRLINDTGEEIKSHKLKNRSSRHYYKLLEEISFSYMVGASCIRGCSMCISKKVKFAIMNLPELQLNHSLGHDWYLNIIASLLGRNFLLNRPLLKYRIHNSNLSLGGLRKTALLSATNEKRNRILKETILAHQYLLNTEFFSSRITYKDKKLILNIILFFQKRLKFTKTKSLFIHTKLLFEMKSYYQCEKSLKHAIRMYITDFFYAFNINWRLKR